MRIGAKLLLTGIYTKPHALRMPYTLGYDNKSAPAAQCSEALSMHYTVMLSLKRPGHVPAQRRPRSRAQRPGANYPSPAEPPPLSPEPAAQAIELRQATAGWREPHTVHNPDADDCGKGSLVQSGAGEGLGHLAMQLQLARHHSLVCYFRWRCRAHVGYRRLHACKGS